MNTKTRLIRLENDQDKISDKYITNAPTAVLKAIIDGSFVPTWAQIVAGDYELQETSSKAHP